MKVTITLEDLDNGELSIKCNHDGDGSKGQRNASAAWSAALDALQFLADSSDEVFSAKANADGKSIDLIEQSCN